VDTLDLPTYHLYHAIRANLQHRLHRDQEAAAAYDRALTLTDNTPERTFLQARRAELGQRP
jgi:RNA polymerase sigma-70 factor (ECF subfamily)